MPHSDVVAFVRDRRLHGRGIGWIDAHLLASALVGRLRLWTIDPALAMLAKELGIDDEEVTRSADFRSHFVADCCHKQLMPLGATVADNGGCEPPQPTFSRRVAGVGGLFSFREGTAPRTSKWGSCRAFVRSGAMAGWFSELVEWFRRPSSRRADEADRGTPADAFTFVDSSYGSPS